MKKIFLLFFIFLFIIPLVLAVPVSYKGTITYGGDDITTDHTLEAVSATRTTTNVLSQNSFVINHLVKKGEVVKFYFDDNLFTEYIQPLPGSVVDIGVWDISAAGLTSDLYKAKGDLIYELILNGNPSGDNVIADLYLPTSLADYPSVTISWASSDASIATDGTVTRDGSDHVVELTVTLSAEGETSITSTFTVTVQQVVAAVVPDAEGKVEIGYDEPEIVINSTTIEDIIAIEIPESVSPNEVVVLNLESLKVGDAVTLGSNDLTLTRNTNSTLSYSVELPSGTEISGTSDWNGLISLPTVKDVSEVTPLAEAGVTKIVDVVIELGSTGVQLTFSNAAKITVPNMAGKKAGYTGADDVFHTIPACTAAQIADPNTLAAAADCYTSSGSDLIIWTKHFTKFAAYTETSTGGGGGGGRGSDTCYERWVCDDWAPTICPTTRVQTRTCTDANNCGTTQTKPPETRVCFHYVAPAAEAAAEEAELETFTVEQEEATQTEEEEGEGMSGITGAAIAPLTKGTRNIYVDSSILLTLFLMGLGTIAYFRTGNIFKLIKK
ncbi:MAG: immunoglobulin-like domain-containing protein [Nanoarchaeota archaeon]|nr:immunoglobulin-like domain-containing protein [Nanoarchaeota archaeon]